MNTTALLLLVLLLGGCLPEKPCEAHDPRCPVGVESAPREEGAPQGEPTGVKGEKTTSAREEKEVSVIEEEIRLMGEMIEACQRKLELLERLRKAGGGAGRLGTKELKEIEMKMGMVESVGGGRGGTGEKGKAGLRRSLFLKETKSVAGAKAMVMAPVKSFAGGRVNQLSFGLFRLWQEKGEKATRVSLTDLYLNEVLGFKVEGQVKLARASPHYDDIFLATVTEGERLVMTGVSMVSVRSLERGGGATRPLKGEKEEEGERTEGFAKGETSKQTRRAMAMYRFEVEEERSAEV